MKINFKNLVEIKKELIRSGYTQGYFAEKAGISMHTLSSLFRGERNPSPTTAKKFCDALGKDFDDLFEIVEK